ncbi:putative TonB-dependent receptor [Flavihumibacter petaseus NBRC 106054]|uniref:Putative TonB-dependent receptor n=1 Tax=Flavihumibacter petaseus NBRC 106054 TaxID=1220578 RepID=A0A0E9N4A5_9BACT|nr:putative TonB-dependent receptor [Flavihumibacter petaseus NBRC 106054]
MLLASALAGLPSAGFSQQKKITITGTIRDSTGAITPGISIVVKSRSGEGTSSDMNGKFVLDVLPDDELEITAQGFSSQTIAVSNRTVIDIVVKSLANTMQDVVVTAYGRKQRKEATVGSVTTIKPGDLKIPASNLTTALSGQIAGLISYQRSGQPGADNANFFVRGVTTFGYKQDPLILIDNVELTANDLARIQVDDIASFSILKDASATALYGARGANGVILVTTKEGKEGKAQINLRLEESISQPTQSIELADPITYMRGYNEAIANRVTDENRQAPRYTENDIRNRMDPNRNQYVYPVVNWMDMLMKSRTANHRMNMGVSGGGKVARYYISGSAMFDNGTLKKDDMNTFSSNAKFRNYQLRSNVNVNITSTTQAVVRLSGNFDEFTGPISDSGDINTDIYSLILHTSPVDFPAYYAPDAANAYTQHILFGNTLRDGNLAKNPYAELMRGYQNFSRSRMSAQIELTQKLGFITEGLNFRGLLSTNRFSYFDVTRRYNPFYYTIPNAGYDKVSNSYTLSWLNNQNSNFAQPTEYLDYVSNPWNRQINSFYYLQGVIDYDRKFGEHGVSASVVATRQQSLAVSKEVNDLLSSLPYRNIGLAGRATYSYSSRYFLEFNFGYNGSERFSEQNRYGFFPTLGASWVLSNEKFWKGGISDIIQRLKLRASHGLSGNDAISDERFYYMSNVNLNGPTAAVFGLRNTYSQPSILISRYQNNAVTWEQSLSTNLGLEMQLFKGLNITAEVYRMKRSNILQVRNTIPTTLGLEAPISANLGKAETRGIDLQADYTVNFAGGKGWIKGRGNMTFSRNKYTEYEEPQYDEPWRSRIGQPLNRPFGYIAERLFVDDKEVAASPQQNFPGETMAVRGGDIKYRDVNGDGIISERDQVFFGYPTVPEIIYGFGASSGYKGFDLSFFFQGSARSSFFVDPNKTAPFVNNTNLLQVYADSHWSEENQDLYAIWPRYSPEQHANNTQMSTWYMRNGSFLRLKSVELGYTVPARVSKKLFMQNLRVYVNGMNLICWSPFKDWDPELAGNGLAYPIQRVFSFAINANF